MPSGLSCIQLHLVEAQIKTQNRRMVLKREGALLVATELNLAKMMMMFITISARDQSSKGRQRILSCRFSKEGMKRWSVVGRPQTPATSGAPPCLSTIFLFWVFVCAPTGCTLISLAPFLSVSFDDVDDVYSILSGCVLLKRKSRKRGPKR